MKYIKIPKPITLKHESLPTQEPVTFYKWLEANILNCDPFKKGYEGLKAAFDLTQTLRTSIEGEVVPIENTTWDKLINAVDIAEWSTPVLAMQWLPFMETIKNAKDKKEN